MIETAVAVVVGALSLLSKLSTLQWFT
jgi:hypothetical protein